MNALKIAACIPLVLAFSAPVVSQAAESRDNKPFEVRLEVQAGCAITADDINFGVVGVIQKPVDANGLVSVTCTSGQAYDIMLDTGSHTSGTTSARLMTNPQNNETISYQLYTDDTKAVLWGTSVDTNTVKGIGNGTPQTYSFPAVVPVPAVSPSVGVYTDTVTATLYY